MIVIYFLLLINLFMVMFFNIEFIVELFIKLLIFFGFGLVVVSVVVVGFVF